MHVSFLANSQCCWLKLLWARICLCNFRCNDDPGTSCSYQLDLLAAFCGLRRKTATRNSKNADTIKIGSLCHFTDKSHEAIIDNLPFNPIEAAICFNRSNILLTPDIIGPQAAWMEAFLTCILSLWSVQCLAYTLPCQPPWNFSTWCMLASQVTHAILYFAVLSHGKWLPPWLRITRLADISLIGIQSIRKYKERQYSFHSTLHSNSAARH